MTYTICNFKTKKAIKDAIKAGEKIACYNPGLGGSLAMFTGKVTLEGPHFPEPHKWYANADLVDGFITKIK